MKIATNKIPGEGMKFTEIVPSQELDLDTEIVRFDGPVKLEALVSKITNAVTINLDIYGRTITACSRCLNEFEADYQRNLKLSYAIEKPTSVIDLTPEIREEIIMNYPINPLCNQDCKGLCPKCGQNLNKGGCCCATTKTKTL